jgi:hypothetical protein
MDMSFERSTGAEGDDGRVTACAYLDDAGDFFRRVGIANRVRRHREMPRLVFSVLFENARRCSQTFTQ